MHPAAAFIKPKYFKTRAKEGGWGWVERRGLNIYIHVTRVGRKESRGCSRRQRIQETTSSFPFSQMRNGCLADRADENLSSVSSFLSLLLSHSKVKLSFDGEVVLTIVCGNGSKLESFPYRKKEIVIIIFVFRFFYRGIQVINGVIGGLWELSKNISDGGNRFLTITKWPLPFCQPPPLPPPPCSIIPRET